jgi:hypothetical protein
MLRLAATVEDLDRTPGRDTCFVNIVGPDPASIARCPRSIPRGYQTGGAYGAEPQQASTYAEPTTGGCEMIVG